MGVTQSHTTLRDPPRMEFRRQGDIGQPRVVRVWSFAYRFGAKKTMPIVSTVRAEIRWNENEQTTMETLRYFDLMEMEGGKEAVAEFAPAFL